MARETTTRVARRDLVVRARRVGAGASVDVRVHAVRVDDASTPRCVVLDAASTKRRARDADEATEATRAVRTRDAAMQRVMCVAASHGVGCEEIVRTNAAKKTTTCAPVVATRRVTIGKRKNAREAVKGAHADFIREFREVCGGGLKESGETTTKASEVVSSRRSESTSTVIFDSREEREESSSEARLGIAVTTRHAVRTVQSYRPRWRRWLPERAAARWPTNPNRQSTAREKTVSLDVVTVAEPVSLDVDDVEKRSSDANATPIDWSWPFLHTGTVADGLIRAACVRNDGRERTLAAAVEIADDRALADPKVFTYEDLFARATKVASFMRDALKVKPGDVVGVLSANSHEVYVLHYACAMTRCVLLNLNTHLVGRELAYITRDSACKVIVARGLHGDVLREVLDAQKSLALDSIVWIDDDDSTSTYPRGVRNYDWNLDVVAYEEPSRALVMQDETLSREKNAQLYYTSGTTGNPKGVCLTHDIVRLHASATSDEMNLHESDVWLHAAPMFHLVDAFAIYSITDVAGRHVFLQSFEASRLLRVIALERVTVSNLASTMVTILSHNPYADVCDLSSVRLLSCGGSPLPPTVVKRAIALFGCEFFVSYGMTECCGKISMSILSEEFRRRSTPEEQLDAICTSGRPFKMISVKVTRSGNPREEVPRDGETVGDIRVKGPTVFSGYLNNPDATSRAFDDAGWFTTGDLGVVRPDGYIVVVDRKKDMILSGGENVYCVEVERVLHAHESVKHAAVFGIPHAIMGETVHAAMTLRSEREDVYHDALKRDLAKHCADRLSQFKCPVEFHFVELLPMNANGKVLKRSLRELITDSAHHRLESRLTPLQRQFSRALITPDPKTSARTKVSLDAQSHGEIEGAEIYTSSLTPLPACERVDVDAFRSGRWWMLGTHVRLSESLRALGAHTCVASNVFDAHASWLDHASRYFRALEKMEDGDAVVLTECLCAFEIAHSGANANADASTSIASATFMISGLVIALLQAVHALGRKNVRVVVVTSNAFVASDESELDGIRDGHVSQAPVMAMLRVLRREHPNIDFATLDMPRDHECVSTDGLERALRRVVDVEGAFAEREIAVNDSCASVPRLRRASPPRVETDVSMSFGHGACVIVGGLGALGLMHLSFFVETFEIRRFVLVGRSVRDVDAVKRAVARARGLEIYVVAADCCDKDQCRAVFALAEPVSVTLHLAGVLHEAAAVDVTRARFVDAVEAKIIGSLNVFERLSQTPSDVALASTSIFGSIGQTQLTCYAAANAFQDALCAVYDRSTRSGPRRVVAVQWGTWDEDGMAARAGDAFRSYWRSVGMGFLSPRVALEFARRVISADGDSRPTMACFPPTNWLTFANATRTRGAPTAFIEECLPPLEDSSSSSSVSSDARASPARAEIAKIARDVVLDVLDARDVGDDDPLMSVGLTSTRAIQLTDKLSRAIGRDVPSTLAFDYPTLRAVVDFLAPSERVGAGVRDAIDDGDNDGRRRVDVFVGASSTVAPTRAGDGTSSASGVDVVGVVPVTRWDANARLAGTGDALCPFGAFIDDVAAFDFELFGVSRTEARVIDPQQRLVLRAVHALPPPSPDASVHVGISQIEHPRACVDVRRDAVSPHYATSAHLSVAAGRVSYVFDLRGCAESVDTACSSSLVAVHRAFVSRETDAVAGGVNLVIDVTWSLACRAAGMLAADGRCKTLDASADGYVRAERCAFALLGPTRDEANLRLAGAAVNQDGRSSSLTAPNGPSQTRVIRAAYEDGRAPERVSLHGTGTPLGDPIEVGALKSCSNADDGDERVVWFVATKSSVGHAEPASGIVALLLSATTVRDAVAVPVAHLRRLNRHVVGASTDASSSRCVALRERGAASHDASSSSASAFAFQGTNAHALARAASASRASTTFAETRALETNAHCWFDRVPHACVISVDVAYGRLVYASIVVGARPCAALFDHVVRGEPIAPATAMLELFAETVVADAGAADDDTARRAHARDVVIPHPMRLTPVSLVARVVARRRDGRVSVVTGPLCRPRTHLYGRVARALAVASRGRRRASFTPRSTPRRHLRAVIGRREQSRSNQPRAWNADVVVVDACVHSAESAIQFDGAFAARVPAALDSMVCERRRRDESSSSSMTVTGETGMDARANRRSRASRDHRVDGARLRGLDVRPPVRAVITSNVSSGNERASTSTYATARETRTPNASTRRRKSAEKRRTARSDVRLRARRDVASFVQTHHRAFAPACAMRAKGRDAFDTPAALAGAARSALHELAPPREISYFATHVSSTRDADVDAIEDPWCAPYAAHGAVSSARLVAVRLAAGRRRRPRRDRASLARVGSPVRRRAAAVVYGGLGALGFAVARASGDAGEDDDLVLVGRRGRTARDVSSSSTRVLRVLRVDAALAEDSSDVPRLERARVVYASGVLADASLSRISAARVFVTFAPKTEACQDAWLDSSSGFGCRAYFSSATACVGNAGQCAYGAANATLDRRNAFAADAGVECASIQWGAFSGGGMASRVEGRMVELGVGLLSPKSGAAFVRACLASRTAWRRNAVCVSAFDWSRYATRHARATTTAFFRDVVGDGGRSTATTRSSAVRNAVARDARASVDARRIVADTMKTTLGVDVVAVNDAPLFELGLDSLSSVEFTAALDAALGRPLPATLVFDYPSASALVRFIETLDDSSDASVATATTHPSAPLARDDFVVERRLARRALGFAFADVPGRFADGDGVSPIDRGRWDVDAFAEIPRFSGLCAGATWRDFDGDAFGARSNEVVVTDPQQRATLRHAARCFAHAPPNDDDSTITTAVYIGAATCDYKSLCVDAGASSNPFFSAGCAFVSVIAGRVSFVFNLSGASLAIDTACSSALCAAHCARVDVDADRWCVGGVNALFDARTSAMFARAGMLTPDGRCKTLDAAADGYARAEACVVFLSTRVGDDIVSRNDGDASSSTVCMAGTAVNQDGRSSSLVAPNGPSQTRAIRDATATANVDLDDDLDAWRAMSLHGTGTALGDPIEIGALRAFARSRGTNRSSSATPLLATKSARAHSESPSGLIGLTAACDALTRRWVGHIVHLRLMNAHCARDAVDARVVAPRTRAARFGGGFAGTSAFAFQGTNAHCVAVVSTTTIPTTRRGDVLWNASRHWPIVDAVACARRPTYVAASREYAVRVSPDPSAFDHVVNDRPVLPGAAFLVIARASAVQLSGARCVAARSMCFVSPCILARDSLSTISMTISAATTTFRDATSRRAFATGRTAVTIDASVTIQTRRASLARVARARAVVVTGVIGRRAGERDAAAAVVDASFHFLAATWTTTDVTLKIPTSVDAFVVDGRVRARVDAADASSTESSTHSAGEARAIRLRVRAVAGPSSSGGGAPNAAASVEAYAMTTYRKLCAHARAETRRIVDSRPRPLLGALAFPTFYESLRLTESCSSHGVVAALRSVALERRRSDRVRVASACARTLERRRVPRVERGFRRRAARLEFLAGTAPGRDEMIVVGGTGAVGGHVTRYLAPHAFSHVRWASTSGRGRRLDATTRLLRNGALTVAARDGVFSLAPVAPVVVVHAAGALADASFRNITAHATRVVVASKRASTDARATTIFCTSVAGALGSIGQASYAGANEMLDARASASTTRGLRARAFQFGPWSGGGMGDDDEVRARLRAMGVAYASPEETMAVVRRLASDARAPSVTCVCRVDWRAYAEAIGRCEDELLERVVVRVAKPTMATTETTETKTKTRGRVDALQTVLACVERVVGAKIDVSAPFMDSGVDSIASTELADELSRAFSMKLSSTFLFDYPTPAAAARFVAGDRAIAKEAPPRHGGDGDGAISSARDRVIIVGARVECDVSPRDVDESQTIPHEKWSVDALRRRDTTTTALPPTTFVNAMSHVSHFDADAFGVNHEESRRCDCQQRLALRAASVGLDDVGTRVGVHLGVASREYGDAVTVIDPSASSSSSSSYDAVGSFISVVSGRVSYVFDFTGPSCSVDTACSSSLVAAHHARAELIASSVVVVASLVGGVNVILHPRVTEQFNRAGMLSPSGRCHALDALADGYARAESCRMFRFSVKDDENGNGNDDDVIVLIARASVVNQDGRSSALTAPNGNAQRAALAACERADADAVVAHLHGTGTPLGDPIEVIAVAATMKNARLEASKSWFGHAEPASGVVSLSFLAAHLSAEMSFGARRLAVVNPHLVEGLASTSIADVNRERTSCARVDGGASAFAFQGTNARVALWKFCGGGGAAAFALEHRRRHIEHARRFWFAVEMRSVLTRASVVESVSSRESTVVRFHGDCDGVVDVKDHRVDGRPVFPGAGMMHLMSRVGECLYAERAVASTYVVVASVMRLSERETTTYVVVARVVAGACSVSSDGGERCTSRYLNAVPRWRRDDTSDTDDDSFARTSTADRLRATHDVPLDARAFYDSLLRRGLEYGRRFRALRDIRGDGARSRIAVARDARTDAAFIAALDGAFHLGAPLDSDAPLAIPIGADASRLGPSTTRFDEARAHAVLETKEDAPSRSSFSSHALVPNGAREDARVVRLGVKSVARRRVDATSRRREETRADAYSCTRRATSNHAPRVYCGAAVEDFARHAATCLGVVASRRDASWRVVGVDAEHASGLFKTAASESYDIDAMWSRGYESCACVDVLTHARRLNASRRRRRPGTTTFFAPNPPSDDVRVVGGFGALGGVTASSALRARVPEVVLTGRTGRGRAVDAFFAPSTRFRRSVVRGVASDVAARCEVDASPSARTTRDIFASGTLVDGALSNHTARGLFAVCAPKSCAVERRRRRVASPSSARFMSSVASLLGSSGQANYAAANGALDFIARARRRAGSDDVALQFGPWLDVGMATRREASMRRLSSVGVRGLSAERGARALETTCRFASAATCVAAFDLRALAASMTHLDRAFFGELGVGTTTKTTHDRATTKKTRIVSGLSSPSSSLRFTDVQTSVSAVVARVLGATVDADAPLMQHGLDSLSAVDLAAAVGTRFAVDAPSTLFFDHPTVAAAAREIVRQLGGDAAKTRPVESLDDDDVVDAPRVRRETPRVVVFAGEPSLDVDVSPRDAVIPTPVSRERDAYEGAANAFGGFVVPTVARLAVFDSLVFGPASAGELATLDPRQRLTLDATAACVRALDDARSDCGVYVGCAGKDYANLLRSHGVRHDAFKGTGNESSVVAGRVSFVFAFRGPSVSVDTACSSSLCAAVVALDGLAAASGSSAAALSRAFVVGASLILTDDMHRVLGGAGMLSPSGRCKTFDADADGYGRGEGVETLVASTVASDGGGTGTRLASGRVNQDGRSSALTAPNGTAQEEAMRLASRDASRIDDTDDDHHEYVDATLFAHGTGTALGDPIEANASSRALCRPTRCVTFQALKSWTGHAEPASGALALAVGHEVACRARRAFGACHLRRLSPYVRVDGRAYVPRANASLGSLARVNVHTSAFAFQGTNAHVVMASSSEGVGRARAPSVNATFSRERRFWPTRAPTIRAVETTTTSCACTFTVRWESSRDAIALCVRAAVERALDDDAFTLARFVVRRRGAEDVVVVRVRAANDGVTSSAGVARVRRGRSDHSRCGVPTPTTRSFVLASRATPRRLARARGFGVFDADVDACEAMVARHVDASASVTFAETTNGGVSCASLDDGASLVVAVGVRRRRRSRGRVETLVAYEVIGRDRETRNVVTAPTNARMASTTVALTHAAFAVPSRADAFVAVGCGEGVETVLRSARRELDVGGGRSMGRIFEETRPVRALDESSLSSPLSSARRDVLVVGGTGALGRVVVNAAARSSVAASRRGRASADVSAPHERVVVRTDSSLRSETRDVFARCAYETVVHAAGLLADGTLLRQTHAASRDVFAPKLVAVTQARRATTASPRFHVYFSSVAALVSPAGQANYASANAALDELAVESRERGFRATSVRWGAFEGAGMAATPTARAAAARLGLGMLPVAVGARVLAAVLAGASTPAVFVVSPLASTPSSSSAKTTQTNTNLISRHSVGADDVVRASTVERAIETVVADLVGVAVPRDAPMMRAGLDSVSSVELRDVVCRRFDVRLPATAAFDHPTIRDLAARVVDELSRERRSANDIAAATEPALDAAPRGECRECVAFARSGRFPVGALDDDDDALLRARSDAAVAVPTDRWRVRTTHDDARFGAFLSRIDAFDRAYFATGPAEAAAVDPQHRGALERVAACRLDADVDARDVCVFAGIQHVEYGALCELERDAALGPFAATGRALSACAGRVSFVFGFRGAAVAVDTACSASLVTMHLAFGDRSSATAHACVGVNYTLVRETFDAARVAGMLARDGRCKTFDASADGYGRAEAVACLFMRAASSRCETASSAAGASFVVRSTACGQDGRSSSLTAPNGPAQTRVVVEARRALGPAADEFATDVSTHGTGTPLGDPIECESLRNAFEGTRDGAHLPPLALSASKSRAGHAEAAAGSTATFQLAARLVADEAPFVVGLRVVNPYVRAPTARCRIPRARSSATRRARVAGCSAFAFVGTNAHVVAGTASDDATTAARRRVAFDREACWSMVTPPNALKRATRAMSGGLIAFVARMFSAAAGLATARIMVACASACVDSYRTRRRVVGVEVVVAPTNECTESSFRVRCARGEATNDASGASCRFASARERRVRSTTRAPRAFATSETTVRLRAYAIGGGDDDGLDELVVVARRARVRCADAYAPTDDASTSSERAATFSVVTADAAMRVCPSRRARETARGVSFDARPTRAVASISTRATERKKRPAEEIPRRSRRAPPEDVAAVVDDVLLHIFGERVDPNDDLASRGLDSIGAVELATTLARRLELEGEIDTPTLATLPTPRAVTAFVMRAVGSRETESETETETTSLSRVVADANADSTRAATRRDAAVKCLKPSASAPSLFLGAPAFGDGQLAYMKLVRALELGAHPAHTLERDVTEEPWPRASIEHAREIERRQREGPIVVGGHSLGGVLAVETALALERAGRDVSTILLFDAPHPVQFKSEWNDVPPEPTDQDDEGAESTGLTYMEVALTSFHFDTVAAGWSTMTREEKYAVFEDVAFQALGREFDARRLDRDISGGPYAAQWNSGMRRMDDGSIDTGSWWMLRGAEAAGDAAPAPAKKKFSRLRGKVVHYKAGIENSALFETTLRFDGGRETLESVGGYVWALSCDHVEIVRCRGTHMNLMTMECDGGDLGDTVVPHARRELADAWEDAMPTKRVEKTNAADEDSWTSRAWHRPLGLWMRVSPNLADVVVDASMNEDDDDDDDERFPSVVDDPDRFDEIAFGLNRLAWHAPATSTPHVWLLADLLRDVSSWSHACFASAAPCRAVHLPDAALCALLDDDNAQAIAARCVRAIRRAAGLRDPSSRFDVPVVVAVLGFDAARESIACETARQLIRRGERAIAVIVPRPDASSPRDDDPCRASRPALQALRAVLDDARPATDDDFAFLLARFRRIIADADLGASRRRVVDAAKRFVRHHRPPTTTTRAWRAAVDDAVALAERVVDAARDAFHPDLVGARP